MRTRVIELYFGHGADSGTWSTDYVDIPFNTPDDKISEVAIEVGKSEGSFAFVGLYAIPSLDDEINFATDKNDEVIAVGDTVDCDETDSNLEFRGTVTNVDGEFMIVEDMDGDSFHIDPKELEVHC